MIYLDHAATTPLRSQSIRAMAEVMEQYGNPSSAHTAGTQAMRQYNACKCIVAHCLGCHEDELIFVSSGTQANALALHGRTNIATSAIEHVSVLKNAHGARILPVGNDGVIDLAAARTIIPQCAFVSVQYANNELGTLQPVREIAELAHQADAYFHTDAVQAVGHVPICLQDEPIDLLSLSAHKFGGPVGIGALYCKRGTPLYPLFGGGAQQQGRYAGTESLLLACGMAAALQAAVQDMAQETRRLLSLKHDLTCRLTALGGMPVTERETLASHLSIRFDGMDAEALLHALDLYGICVSAGAACHAHASEPSHVLTALGMTASQAKSCLRITLGHTTTSEDIDTLCRVLAQIIKQNTST